MPGKHSPIVSNAKLHHCADTRASSAARSLLCKIESFALATRPRSASNWPSSRPLRSESEALHDASRKDVMDLLQALGTDYVKFYKPMMRAGFDSVRVLQRATEKGFTNLVVGMKAAYWGTYWGAY